MAMGRLAVSACAAHPAGARRVGSSAPVARGGSPVCWVNSRPRGGGASAAVACPGARALAAGGVELARRGAR